MYLSCLTIDSTNPVARHWIANPYRVHQRLHLAFAGGEPGGRMLFRIEEADGQPRVIVQAPTHADWSAGFDDMRVLRGPARQKEVSLKLRAGQHLRFLVRANPTRRLTRGEAGGLDGDTKRIGLLAEPDQRAWFERKAERGGFRPSAFEVRSSGLTTFRRGQDSTEAQTHAAAVYEGYLDIINAVQFLETVRAGIGSAKAFGFGLMSLAPG